MRAGRAAAARQGDRPRTATSMSTSTARSAASRTGFAAADVVHEGAYSTSRVQHAHLETHGSIAWTRDGRARPRPHQLAGAVHRAAEALPPLRPARAGRARLHRAGRRRVRRQAGDADRGSLRARRAEDRAAGEMGVHARGAVHRRHDPPPDDHRGQGSARAATARSPRSSSASSPTPAPMAATAARRSPRRSPARSRPTAARTRRPTATPSTPTWCRAAASAATAPRRPPSPSSARSTIWRKSSGSIRSRSAAGT